MYKNLKNVLRPHIFDLDISWIGKKTFEKKLLTTRSPIFIQRARPGELFFELIFP